MGNLFPDDPEYPDYRSMPKIAVKFLGMTVTVVPAVVLVVTVGVAPLCPVPHKLRHQPHLPNSEFAATDVRVRDAGVSTGGGGIQAAVGSSVGTSSAQAVGASIVEAVASSGGGSGASFIGELVSDARPAHTIEQPHIPHERHDPTSVRQYFEAPSTGSTAVPFVPKYDASNDLVVRMNWDARHRAAYQIAANSTSMSAAILWFASSQAAQSTTT